MCKNYGKIVFQDSGGGLSVTQNSAIPQAYCINNLRIQSAVHKNKTANDVSKWSVEQPNSRILHVGFNDESTLSSNSQILLILNMIILIRFQTSFCDHNRKRSTNFCQKFDVLCTMHHPTICIWINKMHKILVIRLYFLLDALHVSDYVSPSSGATFISCTSHLVYGDTSGCCVVIATQHLCILLFHIHILSETLHFLT